MNKWMLSFVVIGGAALPGLAAAGAPATPNLYFLVGDWDGSGSGTPGQGMGTFSFKADLNDHILVRRAHSEYPATADHAAVVHDDLMVVYADQSKAIYFDNEGHVIHYDVQMDADTKGATFLSTDPMPLPLFRLTYRQRPGDELLVSFDIAQSHKVQDLKPYVSGTATRSKAASP